MISYQQDIIISCAKSTWYPHRQHSYKICKDLLSHNSWMKNLNFTNSCTINMNWNIYTIFIQLKTFFEKSVKTINSNNSTKFEVNWRRGSQFVTYEKSPTIWWIKSHNSGMKIQNFTIKYTDRKTINSNNSVKFEVNWPRGS